MKTITKKDIPSLLYGAGILGSGGGGNPFPQKQSLELAFDRHGPVTLISHEELEDDDIIIPVCFMGAPSVSIEKLPSGNEFHTLFTMIERYCGKRPRAIMPAEIGGSNALEPFLIAGSLGVPVVDADCIGRAFPDLTMSSCNVLGLSPSTAFLADGQGNSVILELGDNNDNGRMLEHLARAVTIAFGSSAALVLYVFTGAQVRKYAVLGSISRALAIGNAVRTAQENNSDPLNALVQQCSAYCIGTGAIEDATQSIIQGFLQGTTTIINSKTEKTFQVLFKNENLIVYADGIACATTPDIISIVEQETGIPLTNESLRYGARVAIVTLPADPLWYTKKALTYVGPRAFGYSLDYKKTQEAL